MKNSPLIFSLPLLLNCSSPEHFYSQEAPVARLGVVPSDLPPVYERYVSTGKYVYDKELDFYCQFQGDDCLPIKTESKSYLDCKQSMDNFFIVRDEEDRTVLNKIKYTEFEGKYYEAKVELSRVGEAKDENCKSIGTSYLIWPGNPVDLFNR